MSKAATWIWYPGDFEVWLGNQFNNRRTERGSMFPPFWKQDSHWVTVEFSTKVSLQEEEIASVWTEGRFNFMLDGRLCSEAADPHVIWYEEEEACKGYRIRVPKGQHTLNFKIWNQKTPPALFVDGKTIRSGGHWLVTYEDKIWIDENGVAHGSGAYLPAASWNFNEPGLLPSRFSLKRREQLPVNCERIGDGTLYDFGRETFGILDLRFSSGTGIVYIYYGESREEALDKEHCETLDVEKISDGCPMSFLHPDKSKAFRFVYIEATGTAQFDVAMYYEYAPYDAGHSGTFHCSDDELNRIWQVSAYTMELTTREFFVDGIKRDRWVWSGDAIQSYLMNYYLHFDTECVKRTIRQLRGKDPVTAHVNTIMDYTFYWFRSILDYYCYTADVDFIKEMYPRMDSLIQYMLGRTNADGLAEGQSDDWIFVDWVDFPMHKRGALAFEQILFLEALTTMTFCSELLHEEEAASRYGQMAQKLRDKIDDIFWSCEVHAYLHAVEDGELNRQVTKFPNMFAIIYGVADDERKRDIMEHVLLNPAVDPITTPYMRFYELEALCQMGQHQVVLAQMKNYWGGMLRLGATTFWEKYNPEEAGTQHLAMYGRPYGKSLCHAWGASPIYIIGKYFLGVKPTKAGYEEYEVRPALGGLEWMEGDVPTPFGKIHVRKDKHTVSVKSDGGRGTLIIDGQRIDIPANELISVNYGFM